LLDAASAQLHPVSTLATPKALVAQVFAVHTSPWP